jgi:Uma2 family endonuclease
MPALENAAELVKRLDDIPLSRVRLRPVPGTATEKDVIQAMERSGRLCELVDGILVEKPMGFYEARLGAVILYYIELFLDKVDLGLTFPADAIIRLMPGIVRFPDISFYSWQHFPNKVLPEGAILNIVPDLAVEVLSRSNTKKEMARKRKEYFVGGCQLVWEINPVRKTVRVYTAPHQSKLIRETGTLDGGDVLPGFKLSVARLFARAGKRGK